MTAKSLLSFFCPALLKRSFDRIESSPISKRIARGLFWSVAGVAVSRGVMLVAWIFVARKLGKVIYGELGMIQSTIGMVGVFSGFGLSMTATKHIAEYRVTDPDRAGRFVGLTEAMAVLMGALMSIGLLLSSRWLAAHTINAPHLASSLRIGALVLFINTIVGAQIGVLSGFEAFKAIARIQFFVGLSYLPILIAGAYLAGLSGVIWGLSISAGIGLMINQLTLIQEVRKFNIRIEMGSWRKETAVLWKFSFPALLSGIMVGPINWLCRAILVNRPDGFAEMGVFNAADQWYTMILFLPGLLNSVILPVLSERLGQNDRGSARSILAYATKINGIVVLPVVVIGALASRQIMGMYGEGFDKGWLTLILVLLTSGFVALQAPFGQLIAASGRMWAAFMMNAAWALVFVGGTLWMVGEGSLGLAAARATGYFFHVLWGLIFAYYLLRENKKSTSPFAKVP